MNFRTTIILIAILAGVSIYFFLTSDPSRPEAETEATTPTAERSLIDVKAEDVTALTITSADGRKLAFAKADGQWRMTAPSDAAVDTWQVDSLVRQLTTLTTRGQVDAAGETTGLDSPRHTVELTGKEGRSVTIAVGQKSALGDHMYVRVGDDAKADVVPAAVYETLEQPVTKYRKTRLVEAASTDIQQITIERDGKKLSLQKDGAAWRITEPIEAPAEASAASDLTYAITGLTASDFATDDASSAAAHGLDRPVATVWFSTEAPTTQPAATQPAGTTIRLGRYDDILRKNVFASISSAPGTVVKLPASVLESFDKTVLDLRDKQVLNIDRDSIQRLSIQTDLAATTQPTTRPAKQSNVTVRRIVETPLPATQPATTQPATTQATTQPAPEPVVKWVFAPESDDGQTIDTSKLDPILNALAPLRATRFLESAPAATRPAAAGTYVLTLVTGSDSAQTTHVIRISDPAGGDGAPVATYNDLVFEIERSLVNHLNENLAMEAPANTTP